VYSDQLMERYLDDPITTEQAFDNGWLLTGDLAYWDDVGRVCLQGRDDDLIKLRDGSRLHPSTLEQLLSELPGVEDAAVIITEPFHSLLGLVVTEEPLEQLLVTLRQQQPNQHLPDKLQRVTSLPYNRNGKLRRNLLHALVSMSSSFS
jgi:acyl-coenzyme A synthetase/AMP-(fatty) acid ligase